MRSLLMAATSALILAGGASAQSLDETAEANYSLDKGHAFLTWTVSHNGLSSYTVNFTDFDADIDFNPASPVESSISLTINPVALETNYPEAEKKAEWETELATDDKFLNGDEHPEITFVSTSVEQNGDNTGIVTGDLTFRGVTQSVPVEVTYNGTGNAPWFGERDLIGFDAVTTISRSDFGVTAMVPMISDEVVIEFSGEFLQDE
ncbi:MAG: YceI family protein [Pseudomonadota bacterium]